jgi:hypothetical protein
MSEGPLNLMPQRGGQPRDAKDRLNLRRTGRPTADPRYHVSDRRPTISLSVEILSITAVGESNDGRISINVKLRNAPDIRGGNRRLRLPHELASRIKRSVGAPSIASSEDAVHVQVPRDHLEEAVRAIRRAVVEFNEAYPSLLAEHTREVERIEAEKAAERKRLQADQQVIDRVMNE